MTKKIISASAILALIAVLGIALYFLSKPVEPPQEGGTAAPDEIHYVLGGEESIPVKSIDVKNKNASFSIDIGNPDADQSERTYSIRTMESLPSHTYSLSTIADYSGKMAARSLVSDDKSDFPLYGLDKPQTTVDIFYTDGSKATLLIGNKAPGSEGYYVTTSDKVYLVTNASVINFLSTPMSLMDKTITPANSAAEGTPSFTKLTLGGTVRPEPITIEPSSAIDIETQITVFAITSPMKADVDYERNAEAVNTSFGLFADEVLGFKTNPSDLAKYGLTEPYSTISITSVDNGFIEIASSAPDADGNINIVTNQSDLIYKIAATDLQWLDMQAYDFMARLAILPNIDAVSDVTVMLGNKSYKFEFSGTASELKVLYNGKELDTSKFRNFYQNLLYASFDSIATEELEEDATPIATYTYTYKNSAKSTDVVKFYKGPARRSFITLNDGVPYFTPSTYLDKINEDILKAIAGEDITTIL